MDTQHLNGLCKFLTAYTDTVKKSELVTSATPYSYFVKNQPASTRNQTYQGTTYSYCKAPRRYSKRKSICTLSKAP